MAKNEFGFIAQQVEGVYPEAVRTLTGNYTATGEEVIDSDMGDDTPDTAFTDKKVLQKDRLFQLLFAAFQEAQTKIAALESRVIALEAR